MPQDCIGDAGADTLSQLVTQDRFRVPVLEKCTRAVGIREDVFVAVTRHFKLGLKLSLKLLVKVSFQSKFQ